MHDQLMMIEADLRELPDAMDVSADPIATLLRQRGHRSVSLGLRTAQVDGHLYDLDAAAESALAAWRAGADAGSTTIRLLRHTFV